MTYTVVWFKRDLRVHDHAPLAHAAAQGAVLRLYVIEPGFWAQEDSATQHYHFLRECLDDLRAQLAQRGAHLHVAVGEVTEVLGRLHAMAPFQALVSHEETGNAFTYARDRALGRWCRDQGVRWQEWPQHGVVRRLDSRDHWRGHWEALMGAPRAAAPEAGSLRAAAVPMTLWIPDERWPSAADLGLRDPDPPKRQRGGRAAGRAVFGTFLEARSQRYRGGISSPLSAPGACSRVSPYLALGCLGMREVVQATRARMAALDPGDPAASRQRAGLQGFLSRLYWHCHFIQKLESEPEIEWRNMHRGYDDLREAEWSDARFAALTEGRTGWPMVDACVAMLRDTGWINFRMRAMLVSVAAYPLWLHWRPVGLWLARQFLDYEPGIHWSQMQMQSGTTGINTTRVYNPVKQAKDHDPQGRFVRQWLPALRRVPDAWLMEPWRMPEALQVQCGVRVGGALARPVVELEEATRQAKARVLALRAEPAVRAAKPAIVERHGSRQRDGGMPRARRRKGQAEAQKRLEFD